MELVLALAILPLGVAALVSVLTGKPLRVEIMHKHDAPQAVAVEQPANTEQAVKESVAETLQKMWMGVNEDDRSAAG